MKTDSCVWQRSCIPIHLPPLRERASDIPALVEYFIDRFAKKAAKKIRRIDKRTMDRLQAYRWPGNIRELQNVVERAVILSDDETFYVDEQSLTHGSPRVPRALTPSKESWRSVMATGTSRV